MFGLTTTIGIFNHDPTRQRAPAYSIGGRFSAKKRVTPGPQYKLEWGVTSKGPCHAPSYSMKGRPKRSIWDSMILHTPGPSAYNIGSNRPGYRNGPTFSFGLPYSTRYSRPGPAPNAYSQPTCLGHQIPHMKGAPAVTIHGRGAANTGFAYDNRKTPGPAGYDAVDPSYTTRRAPIVTLKSRSKLPPVKLVTPGPGAYDPGNGSNVSSPRYSLGVRHGTSVLPLFTVADVSD